MMCGLFHSGIRARDLDTTKGFYTQLLDMRVDNSRPPLDIEGFWLRAALPDSPPSIHVFGGRFAEVDGSIPVGSAAVHHTAIYCKDYNAVRAKLAKFGVNWRGLAIEGARQWQIFVYDPNGIMLELAFDAVAEGISTPEVPAANKFAADQLDWFDVKQYRIFAT